MSRIHKTTRDHITLNHKLKDLNDNFLVFIAIPFYKKNAVIVVKLKSIQFTLSLPKKLTQLLSQFPRATLFL